MFLFFVFCFKYFFNVTLSLSRTSFTLAHHLSRKNTSKLLYKLLHVFLYGKSLCPLVFCQRLTYRNIAHCSVKRKRKKRGREKKKEKVFVCLFRTLLINSWLYCTCIVLRNKYNNLKPPYNWQNEYDYVQTYAAFCLFLLFLFVCLGFCSFV